MKQVEQQISESFARLHPVPVVIPDWEDVLDRSGVRRKYRVRQRAPQRPGRRVALVLALALAVAVGLLASAMFSSSPNVLERAQAALDTKDRILHIVDRWGDGPQATRGEAWMLPGGSLDHVVYRSASGVVGNDCVISETLTSCWNAEQNVIDVYQNAPAEPGLPPAHGVRYGPDWPEGLATALRSGYARLLGKTTFKGRAVYAVLLAVPGPAGPPQFKNASDTLYLDAETYLPVAETMPPAGETRYFDTFEFLPDTPQNRKAVELPAPADAKVDLHPPGQGPPEK